MNTFPLVMTMVTNKSMSKSIEILESCEEEFNVALQEQVELMTEMIMYSIESLRNPKKRLKKAEQQAANVGIDILNSITIDYSFSMVDEEHFFPATYRDWETDRKSTRLNSSHSAKSRMPSSA